MDERKKRSYVRRLCPFTNFEKVSFRDALEDREGRSYFRQVCCQLRKDHSSVDTGFLLFKLGVHSLWKA